MSFSRAEWNELLKKDPDAALRDVTARRELHWAQCHPGLSPDSDFVDCALCGALDTQERNARRELNDPFREP